MFSKLTDEELLALIAGKFTLTMLDKIDHIDDFGQLDSYRDEANRAYYARQIENSGHMPEWMLDELLAFPKNASCRALIGECAMSNQISEHLLCVVLSHLDLTEWSYRQVASRIIVFRFLESSTFQKRRRAIDEILALKTGWYLQEILCDASEQELKYINERVGVHEKTLSRVERHELRLEIKKRLESSQ